MKPKRGKTQCKQKDLPCDLAQVALDGGSWPRVNPKFTFAWGIKGQKELAHPGIFMTSQFDET